MMPTNRAVTGYNALGELKGMLMSARLRGVSWTQIGTSFPSVKIGTLKRIAFDEDYAPKRADICAALGLPITIAVAVCPLHGVVHEKRCPGAESKPCKPRRNWRGLALVLAGLMVNQK